MNEFFVVLDEARIKGSSRPKYALMRGNPDDAIGVHVESGCCIKDLVRGIPFSTNIWRVFLQRTDGKEGKKLLRR